MLRDKKIRILMLVALTVVLCSTVIYFQLKNLPVSYVQNYSSFDKITLGGDFSLIDSKGHRRTRQEFLGKFLLIYFGYSFCPDICPLGLQNISNTMEGLGRDREQVVPIFITLDPQRDTPQHLAVYATNFHPSLVMLTGTFHEIEDIKKKFHVYSARVASQKTPSSSQDYLLDHTTLIYLIDSQGNYLESFPHSTPPETLIKALNKHFVRRSKL